VHGKLSHRLMLASTSVLSSTVSLLACIAALTSAYTMTAAAHGVRTVENLRKFCGIEDPEKLEVRSSTASSNDSFITFWLDGGEPF
jgi:hypothetical protein